MKLLCYVLSHKSNLNLHAWLAAGSCSQQPNQWLRKLAHRGRVLPFPGTAKLKSWNNICFHHEHLRCHFHTDPNIIGWGSVRHWLGWTCCIYTKNCINFYSQMELVRLLNAEYATLLSGWKHSNCCKIIPLKEKKANTTAKHIGSFAFCYCTILCFCCPPLVPLLILTSYHFRYGAGPYTLLSSLSPLFPRAVIYCNHRLLLYCVNVE